MAEFLYPGVYVEETGMDPKPIAGVTTGIKPADLQSIIAALRQLSMSNLSPWSSTHVGDPAVSLVQLFVWPSEQLLYGTNGVLEAARQAAPGAAAYRAFHEHHAFVFARGARTHRESFRSWCQRSARHRGNNRIVG